MSKPAEELPAPGKDAWKDVHAQRTKLAKQGDNRLRSAWEKAKEAGTQKAKREFYYNVFLLDPSADCCDEPIFASFVEMHRLL